MDKPPKIIARVKNLIERNRFAEAHKLLQPLVELEEPVALFLAATFSLPELESEADFEVRSFEFLTKAANSGYPPACYALGVCYDIGDLTVPDSAKAAVLFKRSAENGYPRGKFCHGRNLFYGANGILKEREKGLRLIKEAADEGVEDAAEFLKG
jgi:TPR repeat protein